MEVSVNYRQCLYINTDAKDALQTRGCAPEPVILNLLHSNTSPCAHPPSHSYLHSPRLQKASFISYAIINSPIALSVVHGGARDILPVVRNIIQCVDRKRSATNKMDEGRSVVRVATWSVFSAHVLRADRCE